MRKEVNLVTSICITYLANGIGWLFYAILRVLDHPAYSILGSLILLGCILLSIKISRLSKESEDEMSSYNLSKAKATAIEWLKIIICSVLLLLSVTELLNEFISPDNIKINIDLRLIASLILSVTEIMIGLLFVKYEKDGE